MVGQRWNAQIDGGFRLPSLGFDIVVDARHSRPTKLGITVDGQTQVFDVPALTRQTRDGAVERVTFAPAQPLVGRNLTIEILAVDPSTAPNLYGDDLVLPVGLAEIGLAPTPLASTSTRVTVPCRDDLLTIDNTPVPVKVDGDVGALGDGRLAVTRCDEAPLTLDEGSHVLRTAAGLATGIDLDNLAFVSPQFNAAPSATDRIRSPELPSVQQSSERSATVVSQGQPYWLRLNQSYNRGWEATAQSRAGTQDLGPAHPIGGFASGWFVADGAAGRTELTFTWPPQRTVDIAIAVSGLGVLVCIALVVISRRRRSAAPRRSRPALVSAPFSMDPPATSGTAIAGSAVVVIAGTLFGSPAIGAALLVFAIAAAFAPRARVLAVLVRAAPLVALGAAAAFVWIKQARNDYAHTALWPSYFDLAHALTMFGILALALLIWADRDRDLDPWSASDRGDPRPAGTVEPS